jgi:septal ring factor EnvC (AmiA/AmiB activator)
MSIQTPRSRALTPRVSKNQTPWARQFSERLTRLLRAIDHQDRPAPESETSDWPIVSAPAEEEIPPRRDELTPRFAQVRRGYDCVAVDAYVAGLEAEVSELDRALAELREQLETETVASEIKRLGEETSSVLIAAHETREQMLREAQAEVDRRLAEAERQATAIIAAQEAQTRELQERNDVLRQERDRLLENVRSISSSLAQVADSGREPV